MVTATILAVPLLWTQLPTEAKDPPLLMTARLSEFEDALPTRPVTSITEPGGMSILHLNDTVILLVAPVRGMPCSIVPVMIGSTIVIGLALNSAPNRLSELETKTCD
eukprot:2310777-Rhodomonas_salina.1